MRIMFFSHYFHPEGNAPATRVLELTRRWVQDGHEVTVVTCQPNVPDGRVYPGYRNRLWQRETVEGIQVLRVWSYMTPNQGTKRILNFLSYMVMAAFLALFLRRPQVIIATSPQFFCAWAGRCTAWLKLVPFVLEIRDIWPESITALGAMKRGLAVRVLEWMELKIYRWCRHVVTVGAGYRQKLQEKGVPAAKISVITNGFNRELFQLRAAEPGLMARHGLEGRFVLSYIGTVGMACGLEVLLRAAAKLKAQGDTRIAFLVVGAGASLAELEAERQRLGLDNLVFAGLQPKAMMPAYLASVDACFVHLKKTELFTTVLPSKIFEAAGMKKPIVIGVRGLAEEIILGADCGLAIEPEAEDELIAACQKLAANPALCQAMGERGREHMLAHYDMDKLARDYTQLLQELLDPAGSR